MNNELLQAAKVLRRATECLIDYHGLPVREFDQKWPGMEDFVNKLAIWDKIKDMDIAIARAEASASQPAPDEQREKAIEECITALTKSRCHGLQTADGHAVYQVGGDDIKRAVALMRRAAAPAEPRASQGPVERSVKEREELVREAGDIFASGDGWQTRGECEEWMRNALGLPPAPFPDEVCEGSYEDDPCGPVEHHDEESTPLCARCWNDLTAESERRAAGGAS